MQNARPSIGYHKYSNRRNMCLDAVIAFHSRAPRILFLFFLPALSRVGSFNDLALYVLHFSCTVLEYSVVLLV